MMCGWVSWKWDKSKCILTICFSKTLKLAVLSRGETSEFTDSILTENVVSVREFSLQEELKAQWSSHLAPELGSRGLDAGAFPHIEPIECSFRSSQVAPEPDNKGTDAGGGMCLFHAGPNYLAPQEAMHFPWGVKQTLRWKSLLCQFNPFFLGRKCHEGWEYFAESNSYSAGIWDLEYCIAKKETLHFGAVTSQSQLQGI